LRFCAWAFVGSISARSCSPASRRAPETIRTGEIVRAREGNAPIVECVSGDVNACRIATVCKLAWILIDGLDAPYERLNRYTLGDLMIGRNALAAVLMQQ
jgi:Rrf2 family nitric oxide-sensitive transcriptional repressor